MDERAEPAPDVVAPWREPVRGGHPDASDLARSGREQLEAMIAAEAPPPPLSQLTGMTITSVAPGAATFTMPVTGWLADEFEMVGLGPLTIPVDGAMACAAISLLPPRTGLTTSELALRQVRPARVGETVTADGRIIESGPDLALTEATLKGEDGRLIGHATSLCIPLPMPATAVSTASSGGPRQQPAATPDPYRRPAPEATAVGCGALGVLTGLHPVSVTRNAATLALPATGWLCAPPPGRVQGGVVATLADAAMTAVIRAAAPGGVSYRPVEIKVNFLRPLASDGRLAEGRARLVQAGRRIAVATADVVDDDGRLIALATGSALAARGGD